VVHNFLKLQCTEEVFKSTRNRLFFFIKFNKYIDGRQELSEDSVAAGGVTVQKLRRTHGEIKGEDVMVIMGMVWRAFSKQRVLASKKKAKTVEAVESGQEDGGKKGE
jgi:hypothetical protein